MAVANNVPGPDVLKVHEDCPLFAANGPRTLHGAIRLGVLRFVVMKGSSAFVVPKVKDEVSGEYELQCIRAYLQRV